jgi:hypothetical protein
MRELCGGDLVPGGIALLYFGRPLTVTLPALEILPDPGEMERLLLMHYLAAEGPVPSAGDWLSFHQLPAASFYERPYRRRATDRILRHFGGRPGALVAAGAALGGLTASLGDESTLLQVLPHVEVVVIIHRGDEEIGPEAGMLFRSNVTAFFGLEDVAVLGGVIATRLGRARAV